MLGALTVALALDQRVQVAVDAAGALTENLRTHDASSSWCETTDFTGYYKWGCGLCASSCNSHALTTMAAADPDNTCTVNFSEQQDCINACNSPATACSSVGKTDACSAVSFDVSASTCTLHWEMPVGAVCGETCHANPHNSGDTIAQSRIQSCRNQACYINDNKMSTTVYRLGHGACNRGEGAASQPGGLIVLNELIVEGTVSTDGLTPASTACSSTVTTDCWPPATKLSWCQQRCESNDDCRAFNFGKRFKSCDGVCDFGTQAGEYYCQLLATTPLLASTDSNDLREMGCHAYSTNAAAMAFSTVISVTNEDECVAPYGPDCYVKTMRSSKGYISRGPGYCVQSNGKQAQVLADMNAGEDADGTARTWTMVKCQAECSKRDDCVGLSFGVTNDTTLDKQSFCVLYEACSGDDCPTYTNGVEITQSSTEMVTAANCVAKGTETRCGGSLNADGSILTAAEACSCLNKGPDSTGYAGINGDANWRNQGADKFECCDSTSACRECHESYESECMARAMV